MGKAGYVVGMGTAAATVVMVLVRVVGVVMPVVVVGWGVNMRHGSFGGPGRRRGPLSLI